MWKASLLCLTVTAFITTNASPTKKSGPWWDNIILYQIYPRSFKDSDGDGIGDLNGITSKLEYISEFADAIWLSPINPSPQKDFGYDVSDYKDIHHEYGTLKDFDELLSKAKSLGLKVLLDFVPNHSSDQHEWFKKSVKRIPPYDNYYVWNDGKLLPDGTRAPPNNWLSMFGGKGWEWNEERGQFYYHQFLTSQPDLNYNDANLRKEMEDIITFWLERGVDGFRIDAIPHLFEDAQLRDEPRSGADVPADDYGYLIHKYTANLDETYDVVKTWRELMDRYSAAHHEKEKIGFMEAGGFDVKMVQKYYSIGMDPMNMQMYQNLNNRSSVEDFRMVINRWMSTMPSGKVANWIVGNHDNWRVGSRFGYEGNRADQMSMLSEVLPGMTVLYNGDEIGMVNRFFTYEETIDPAGCNAGPERYQLKSRDPERTPFQWDDSVSAGFSTNPNTWLPVHENYKMLNLARQKISEESHYWVVKALSDLKKMHPILVKGDTKVYNHLDKVLVVVRSLPGWDPVVLLMNLTDEDVEVDGTSFLGDQIAQLFVYVASVKSGVRPGYLVQTKKVDIPKASTVVLLSTSFSQNAV